MRQSSVIRLLPLILLAALPAAAQLPRIGDINFYGVHRLQPEKLMAAMGVHPGDRLPASKGDLEARLSEVQGVVDSRVEAVCCDGPNATLFVGVEERLGPHFDTRGAPSGGAILPDAVMDRYHEYLAASGRSARTGSGADAETQRLGAEFTAYAAGHLALLRDVLRNSSQGEQRAAAAEIVGWIENKSQVINDLQYALADSDESVRANAARSLRSFAVLAHKQPELGLKIAPVWLVAMLNSVVLSDRMQAARTLVVLTDTADPPVLVLLRERALPALVEMARWKTPEYALPPFLLLGRVMGVAEDDLQEQWKKNDRETLIRKAAEAANRGRR